MADIFREVDEDVRRDRAKDLWDRYGLYLIAGVVVVVAGAAAVVGWRHWEQESRRDTAAQYLAVTGVDAATRADALASFAAEQDGVYAHMARLRAAGTLAETDPAGALAAYDALSGQSAMPASLRALAAIRALVLAADVEPADKLVARAGPLVGDSYPYRAQAREILAAAEMARGNDAAARAALEQIVSDMSAPATLRERALLLLDLVRATEAAS